MPLLSYFVVGLLLERDFVAITCLYIIYYKTIYLPISGINKEN